MIKALEKELNTDFFNSFPIEANVYFGIINLDLTTYFWSNNLIELLGWEFDEIKDNFKFIHPEDLNSVQQQFPNLIEGTEQSISSDIRFVSKSGLVIWMTVTFSTYRLGDSTKISAIAKKIHKEKALESKLNKISASFPGLIYRFILTTGGEMYFSEISESATHILGYSVDYFLSQTTDFFTSNTHSDDLEHLQNGILKSAQNLSKKELLFKFKHIDGHYVTLQSNSNPIRLENGDTEWEGVMMDVTKELKFQEELNQKQYFFDEISAESDIFYAVHNLDGSFEFVSKSGLAMLEIDAKELINEDPLQFIHPDDKEICQKKFGEVINNQSDKVSFEHRVLFKDKFAWFHVTMSYVVFDGGPKVVVYSKDITQYKYLLQEKEQVADELTQLIDTANAPIFGIDISGNVNQWNQKAAEITGFSKKDVVGNHFVDTYITDEYRISVKDVLDQALKGVETSNYEVPVFTKNGDRVMVLLNATTRRNVQDDIIGVVGVGQDITEIDNLRRDLTISNTRWQSMIKNENISINEINLDLNITFCSNVLKSVKGFFTKEQIVGSSIYTLNPDPNWKMHILPKIKRLRNFGEYFTDESKFRVEGKTCTIQNQWLPVYEGAKIVSFIIISSDISEKKELEEKSNLLQEKRELLSQQLLSIQEDERKRVARYVHDEIGQQLASLKISLESQNNSISRSLDQIQGLIGTSRKIAKELRPAQLDLLGLKEAIQMLINDSKLNSNIEFNFSISLPSNLSQKLSDTIYRVVQEGIENSVKHAKPTTINIDIKESNLLIEILIQDDGIGIQEKDFNKEGSFGLIGMEERLVPFNGDFSINNTSPGTRLEIRIQQ